MHRFCGIVSLVDGSMQYTKVEKTTPDEAVQKRKDSPLREDTIKKSSY